MNQRILVLGGAGYIGSHTVYALIDNGAEVVVIDNLETGFAAAVHPAATFYHGDIRDAAFLDGVFAKERLDGVIHFAASSQVGESMTDPLKYYDNNLCGTKTLLQAMVRHGLDNIVFSSTAAVYGTPEQSPILETDRTAPINCYGETKLAMENMFRWTGAAHGLRFVSLRYFNACGAHASARIGEAHNPETHLIPLVLQVPLGQRPHISIFGTDYPTRDGTCVRDYIHVTDLADAHILALRYLLDGGASEIFNLGNGIGFTVREVIAAAEQVIAADSTSASSICHSERSEESFLVQPTIPAVEAPRRAGDPAELVASSEKAKRILGWNPTRADLSGIVASAWRWHESHPNGFAQT